MGKKLGKRFAKSTAYFVVLEQLPFKSGIHKMRHWVHKSHSERVDNICFMKSFRKNYRVFYEIYKHEQKGSCHWRGATPKNVCKHQKKVIRDSKHQIRKLRRKIRSLKAGASEYTSAKEKRSAKRKLHTLKKLIKSYKHKIVKSRRECRIKRRVAKEHYKCKVHEQRKLTRLRVKEHKLRKQLVGCMKPTQKRILRAKISHLRNLEKETQLKIKKQAEIVRHPKSKSTSIIKASRKAEKRDLKKIHFEEKKISYYLEKLKNAKGCAAKHKIKFEIKEHQRMIRHYKRDIKSQERIIKKSTHQSRKLLHRIHRIQKRTLHNVAKLKLLKAKAKGAKGKERIILKKEASKLAKLIKRDRMLLHKGKKLLKHPSKKDFCPCKHHRDVIRRIHHRITSLKHKKRELKFKLSQVRSHSERKEIKSKLEHIKQKLFKCKEKTAVQASIIRRKSKIVSKAGRMVHKLNSRLDHLKEKKKDLKKEIENASGSDEKLKLMRKLKHTKKQILKTKLGIKKAKKQIRHPVHFRPQSKIAKLKKSLERKRKHIVKSMLQKRERKEKERATKSKLRRFKRKIHRAQRKISKLERQERSVEKKLKSSKDQKDKQYLQQRIDVLHQRIKWQRTKIQKAKMAKKVLKRNSGSACPCRHQKRKIHRYKSKVRRLTRRMKQLKSALRKTLNKDDRKKLKFQLKESKKEIKSCQKHIRKQKKVIVKRIFLAKRALKEKKRLQSKIKHLRHKISRNKAELAGVQDPVSKNLLKEKIAIEKKKIHHLKDVIRIKVKFIKHPNVSKSPASCKSIIKSMKRSVHKIHKLKRKIRLYKHEIKYTKNEDERKHIYHKIRLARHDLLHNRSLIKKRKSEIKQRTILYKKSLGMKRRAEKKLTHFEEKRRELKIKLIHTEEKDDRKALLHRISRASKHIRQFKKILRKCKISIENPTGKSNALISVKFESNRISGLEKKIDRLRTQVMKTKDRIKFCKTKGEKKILKEKLRLVKHRIRNCKRSISKEERHLAAKSRKLSEMAEKGERAQRKIVRFREKCDMIRKRIRRAKEEWKKDELREKLQKIKEKIRSSEKTIRRSQKVLQAKDSSLILMANKRIIPIEGAMKFKQLEYKNLKKKAALLKAEITASTSLKRKRSVENKYYNTELRALVWRKRLLEHKILNKRKQNKSVHSLAKRLKKTNKLRLEILVKKEKFEKGNLSLRKKQIKELKIKVKSASGFAKKSLQLQLRRRMIQNAQSTIVLNRVKRQERSMMKASIRRLEKRLERTKSTHEKEHLKSKLKGARSKLVTSRKQELESSQQMIKAAIVREAKYSKKLSDISKQLKGEKDSSKQNSLKLKLLIFKHKYSKAKRSQEQNEALVSQSKRDIKSTRKLSRSEYKSVSKDFENRFHLRQIEYQNALTGAGKRRAQRKMDINKIVFLTWRIKYIKKKMAEKEQVGKPTGKLHHTMTVLRKQRRKTVHELSSLYHSREKNLKRKISNLKIQANAAKGTEKEILTTKAFYLTINMFRAKEQSRQLRKHEKTLYARRIHRIENKLLISKSKKERSRLLGEIQKIQKNYFKLEKKQIKNCKRRGLKESVKIGGLKRMSRKLEEELMSTKDEAKRGYIREKLRECRKEKKELVRRRKAVIERQSLLVNKELSAKASQCKCCRKESSKYQGAIHKLTTDVNHMRDKYIDLLSKKKLKL